MAFWRLGENPIFEKLERLDARLDNIDKTLIKQHASIEEHIRRTAINEKSIERLHAEIRPVQSHVDKVDGALKLLGLLGIGATLVFTVFRILALF